MSGSKRRFSDEERKRRKVWASRKAAAAKRGLPFTLPVEFMDTQPAECPCCGVAMERGGANRMTSPSMDRLVPETGYTPANVVWVCMKCNTTKSNHSLEEIYKVADFYWERYKERGLTCPTRLRPLQSEAQGTSTSPSAGDRIAGDDGAAGAFLRNLNGRWNK